MAQRFFIGVVHRAQAAMARNIGLVAFSHGREAPVKGVAPGDAVMLCAPRTDFDGDPVQAFIAHARITGAAPRRREFFPGKTAWARDATFDDVTEVPVRPMLPDLSFVKITRHRGMAFRLGKFAIPEPHDRRIGAATGLAP